MSKLSIGVTIDPASIRPENAQFIYSYDLAQPSPPYLKNPQGDITLPGDKVAVEIAFRMLQEDVRLANNQTYALSLPPKALEIAGPVPGKWPQQFDAPVQTGKPGKPPTAVAVIDRNDDTTTYKYSLGVVFTPRAGLAVTKVDDPKIRNGGDTREFDSRLWPAILVGIAICAVIGWYIWRRGL
jgi:hypothetical protein